MKDQDTGWLLHKQDLELYRDWFKQMVDQLGTFAIYRAPREGKTFDTWGELDTAYYEPVRVGAVYKEFVNQRTAKKMGWNAELSEGASLIIVPYDLPHLQEGALFTLPSSIDTGVGRLFKVLKMEVCPIYPACIICELGPVLKNSFEPSLNKDYSKTNVSAIIEETDYDEEEDD